jgi:predicted cobalt transporter CbtA
MKWVIVGAIFLAILIIAPLFGGVVGWIFATVFPESFRVLQRIVAIDATGFEFGAVLGFIAGFFRSANIK